MRVQKVHCAWQMKRKLFFPIGNYGIMHRGTRAGQRSDGLIPQSGALYIAQQKTTLPVETVVSTPGVNKKPFAW